MRVLSLLTSALLPLAALAAKKTPAERFDAARSKQLAAGAPIQLTDVSYDALTKSPRDYSVAVLLTALDDRFSCQLCKDFQPEWNLLGKSWVKGDKNAATRTVFATLDFLEGKETFRSMQLQTAPVLLLFKPTIGEHAATGENPERYDFTPGTANAQPIHQWLARHYAGRTIPKLVRPINWFKLAVWATAALGAITFVAVAGPYILPFLQNRNLWAAISIICVLLFTSGHMFNQIRNTPYAGGDGKGGVSYIAGGFQNQFGMETQIVAAMYAVLAFATISLALKVPRMTDPRAQQVAVVLWAVVILGMYSFLLSVFRIKNGGYPFWLPPF